MKSEKNEGKSEKSLFKFSAPTYIQTDIQMDPLYWVCACLALVHLEENVERDVSSLFLRISCFWDIILMSNFDYMYLFT